MKMKRLDLKVENFLDGAIPDYRIRVGVFNRKTYKKIMINVIFYLQDNLGFNFLNLIEDYEKHI